MDASEGWSVLSVDSRDGGVENGSKLPYSTTSNARFLDSLETERHFQGERVTLDGLLGSGLQDDGNG